MSNKFVKRLLVVSAVFAVTPAASADHPPRPPIPDEAFSACAEQKEGDSCVVHFRDAVCTRAPGEERLFCRPSGPPPRQ